MKKNYFKILILMIALLPLIMVTIRSYASSNSVDIATIDLETCTNCQACTDGFEYWLICDSDNGKVCWVHETSSSMSMSFYCYVDPDHKNTIKNYIIPACPSGSIFCNW